MIHLTDSEKRAVLILGSVILISLIIQWFIPHRERADLYDYSYPDSLFKAASADTGKTGYQNPGKEPAEPSTKRKKVGANSAKTLKAKSIDINRAPIDQLVLLPGIGKVTAEEIIKYRRENGPFKNLKDLDKVKRIGIKTLQKISPYVFISSDSAQTSL